MQYIGKIDVEKFKKIFNKIITDEVILTDERKTHIIERRGEKFINDYIKFFPEIISDPDYIFKDSRPNTVIVTKKYINNGNYINLIIKLAIEKTDKGYQNSIITAIKEKEKRMAQRIRNNKPAFSKTLDKSE